MRIAITSTGDNPDCELESHFGRAPWIMIFDSEAGSWEPVSNEAAASAAHGAGIRLAELVARKGVTTVVTGSCGPKAMEALGSAGVRVFRGGEQTVKATLESYEDGRLEQLTEPNGPARGGAPEGRRH